VDGDLDLIVDQNGMEEIRGNDSVHIHPSPGCIPVCVYYGHLGGLRCVLCHDSGWIYCYLFKTYFCRIYKGLEREAINSWLVWVLRWVSTEMKCPLGNPFLPTTKTVIHKMKFCYMPSLKCLVYMLDIINATIFSLCITSEFSSGCHFMIKNCSIPRVLKNYFRVADIIS
jgi:hypothetical protein